MDMGKINRSGVYYLINTVTPINHALKAEFDAFGSVIVVVLFWESCLWCDWFWVGLKYRRRRTVISH